MLLNQDTDPDPVFPINFTVENSVVDSDSVNPDPPLVFRIRIRIRIQGFDDQNEKTQLIFFLLWSKIAIYWSLGLHKGRPSCRRSLQPSKENIQHFKRWNLTTFSIFLGHFNPPGSVSGTDPGTPLNPDPDIGSTTLVEKIKNFDQKCNIFTLRPPCRLKLSSYSTGEPVSQKEHSALQNMKFRNFYLFCG